MGRAWHARDPNKIIPRTTHDEERSPDRQTDRQTATRGPSYEPQEALNFKEKEEEEKEKEKEKEKKKEKKKNNNLERHDQDRIAHAHGERLASSISLARGGEGT